MIEIYTDGACSGNPGPGGWGAVIVERGREIAAISGFIEKTTNNRMELFAVIEALNFVLQSSSIRIVKVYSDSAYLVNAFNEGWINKWELSNWKTIGGAEVKNQELWKCLIYYNKLLYLEIIKVRGHSGNPYNERADKLARNEIERNRNKI